MTKTGMTTISIRTTAVNRRSRSASAMGPFGIEDRGIAQVAAADQQRRPEGQRHPGRSIGGSLFHHAVHTGCSEQSGSSEREPH